MPTQSTRHEIDANGFAWPHKLDDLGDAPEMLYAVGDVDLLSRHDLVCVTGARRATAYGVALAHSAGETVAKLGLTLVTGMSIGCELAAARAALEADGEIVAVVGTGADESYPSAAADVIHACRHGHGVVVSAEPWGTPPTRYAFPRRHAIMAALADVAVVCEAGRPSGVLSFAETARDLGRNVFAFPGSVYSAASDGTNELIASDTAYMLTKPSELRSRLVTRFALVKDNVTATNASNEAPLVRELRASPMRPSELATTLGKDVTDILRELAFLETDGLAERLPDGRYGLTHRAYRKDFR